MLNLELQNALGRRTCLPRKTLLNGKYLIQAVVGAGGFGITYLATKIGRDKRFAVKELFPPEMAFRVSGGIIHFLAQGDERSYSRDDYIERAYWEARKLKKLKSTHIVEYYEIFEQNDTCYIVTEYLGGGTLKEQINKKITDPRLNIKMRETWIRDILVKLCHGAEVMHSNEIIHRDIAGDNIMFRDDDIPVYIDLGAARYTLKRTKVAEPKIVTSIFKATSSGPEQIALAGQVDRGNMGPWSDIYSLAALAHLVIFGKPVISANSKTGRQESDDINQFKDLPNPSKFLCSLDRALEFEHSKRPQSIQQWRSEWD